MDEEVTPSLGEPSKSSSQNLILNQPDKTQSTECLPDSRKFDTVKYKFVTDLNSPEYPKGSVHYGIPSRVTIFSGSS